MAPAVFSFDGYPDLRFRCRCCGFCCSHFEVTATADEVERIGKLRLPGGIQPREGFAPLHDNLFTVVKDETRRCRFMDDGGLCQIHRTLGATAKPVACRLYPFSIHTWVDGRVSADLRFICPAVGDPDGTRLADHLAQIREMAGLLRPREKAADTTYSERNPVSLAAVRQVHEGIKAILLATEYPFPLRLYITVKVIDFHSRREMFPAIAAADAGFRTEALSFLSKAAALLTKELAQTERLPLRERIEFRSLVGGYLRDDDAATTNWWHRFVRMRHFVAFGLGGGSLRRINPSCPETGGMECLTAAQGMPVDPDAMAGFEMFFYGKLCAMHFCSRYVHHYTYELGLRHLLLTAPVAQAMAAMFARTEGRDRIDRATMRRALTYIDTAFILSPYFRQAHTRRVLQQLTRPAIYAALLHNGFSGTFDLGRNHLSEGR